MKRLTRAIALLTPVALVLAVVLLTQDRVADRAGGPGGHASARGLLAAVEPAPAESDYWHSQAEPPASGLILPVDEAAIEAAEADAPQALPLRARRMTMIVTAYCPCRRCCGRFSDGKTASGHAVTANGGRFAAADTLLLPFGTRVAIPGYNGGSAVPVLDRGGRIKGNRLDVFFRSHRQAKRWGTRRLTVTVYEQ